MNKLQFYKLFKIAFNKAFCERNIRSSWKQTGLYPLDPSQVLNQLSTKQIPSQNRPTSASSGSYSVISLSDWKKINQVVKEAVGDILRYKGRQILKHYHTLQAENTLLKAQVKGLQEAVRIEKKQRRPRKTLFKELRVDNGNTAIFFSPAKISAARELQVKKAREEEEAQEKKKQEKLQRQQRKEEQAELKKAAATVRQEKREKLAAEKAQKMVQREEAISQRLVSQQLHNEHKAAARKQPKKPRRVQKQAPSSSRAIEQFEEPVVAEQQIQTSRSGRHLRKPQYLDNYQL
jgi:hypothetical protein